MTIDAAGPGRTPCPGDVPPQPDPSLVGGLECLEAVVAAGRPVTAPDVASSLNMRPSRADRLLATLAHLGLLERTPQH